MTIVPNPRPYRKAARIYRRRGWGGPLPLPPRKKETPPSRFTGRGSPYPSAAHIRRWRINRPTANIGLHLGLLEGGQHETIGIDVDHYEDGGKLKIGATQLGDLEKQYGELPPTWRSTNRGPENPSGIRFFRAPAGLAFRGNASDSIDIIQATHRYAVVPPSIHPSGRQYVWYGPDGTLTGIPDARRLPLLPDAWVDYLTNGRTPDDGVPVDVDSSNDEILVWARDTLPAGEMCPRMRRAIKRLKRDIPDGLDSHHQLTDAHWNLFQNAVEGHTGWAQAVAIIEQFWTADVLARGGKGRSRSTIRGEIKRSKLTALRKVKAMTDEVAEIGLEFITTSCPCPAEIVGPRPRRPRRPRRPAVPRFLG
jgi:hypothetical protein